MLHLARGDGGRKEGGRNYSNIIVSFVPMLSPQAGDALKMKSDILNSV